MTNFYTNIMLIGFQKKKNFAMLALDRIHIQCFMKYNNVTDYIGM